MKHTVIFARDLTWLLCCALLAGLAGLAAKRMLRQIETMEV